MLLGGVGELLCYPQSVPPPNRSLDCYALTNPSFCHLCRHFSVTMEPHCALKVPEHMLDYIRPFLAKADFKRVMSPLHWLNEKVQK